MVVPGAFWLNGHMDPACVSAGNCLANHIQWEDEGPGFDGSIYDGWMEMQIDNRNLPCLMVNILSWKKDILFIQNCVYTFTK